MSMSQLRPTLKTASPNTPCPQGGTAYYLVLQAVKERTGLIHGKLDDEYGEHCAIGSYFHIHSGALPSPLIDEVALVNDSVPSKTPKQRRAIVLKWLRWKLESLGLKHA